MKIRNPELEEIKTVLASIQADLKKLIEEKEEREEQRSEVRLDEDVSELFERQVALIRSLRFYRTDEASRKAIQSVVEDDLVKNILEPLASKQRLQIIKLLSVQAHTFSFLSDSTGLRGGNLLFHLQKLIDAGMIIQHHERGDYMLTEKGYKVLYGLSDISLSLNQVDETYSLVPTVPIRKEK